MFVSDWAVGEPYVAEDVRGVAVDGAEHASKRC